MRYTKWWSVIQIHQINAMTSTLKRQTRKGEPHSKKKRNNKINKATKKQQQQKYE